MKNNDLIKSLKKITAGINIYSLITVNILFFIVFLVLFVSGVFQLHIRKTKFLKNPYTLSIQKNQPVSKIANDLLKAGILHSKENFMKWLVRLNLDRKIKSGKFLLKKRYSLYELMNILTKSNSFLDQITVREGLNIYQIASFLKSSGLDDKIFLNLCTDKFLIKQMKLFTDTLEGYLFPDTYKIAYEEEEDKLIKMMVSRFFAVIEELKIKDSLIYKTTGLKQGLIVASLIEKETRYDFEKAKISGVFWNRIKKNWRLDSDVTVRYALKKWTGNLSKNDLKTDSEYNTRLYKGLPPAPICNPGKASIKAAFFPEKTNCMFFVSSEGDGGGRALFSETLKEHNKKVAQLKKEGKL